MQTINILDIKPFMQLLFQTTALDSYRFVSSSILADMSYTLDGHINHSFFNENDFDTLDIREQIYLPWSIAKEKVFQLIKGKKTPTQLKIVFQANNLNVICGISYQIFTMEKALEFIILHPYYTTYTINYE